MPNCPIEYTDTMLTFMEAGNVPMYPDMMAELAHMAMEGSDAVFTVFVHDGRLDFSVVDHVSLKQRVIDIYKATGKKNNLAKILYSDDRTKYMFKRPYFTE
jgi:hypothetical protein